jgi:hypothetical protein
MWEISGEGYKCPFPADYLRSFLDFSTCKAVLITQQSITKSCSQRKTNLKLRLKRSILDQKKRSITITRVCSIGMLSKITPERLVLSNLSLSFFWILLGLLFFRFVSWLVFPGVCDCVSENFGFREIRFCYLDNLVFLCGVVFYFG